MAWWEEHFFGPRRPFAARVALRVARWSVPVAIVGLLAAGIYAFAGPGGDLRLFRARILINGSANRHAFRDRSELAGQSFRELTMRRSGFPNARLSGADFERAKLKGASFVGCAMDRVTLRNAELIGARLVDCNLEGADLRGADLTSADLAGSNLRFALLGMARLRNANLERADLTGAVGLAIADLKTCRNWQLANYDPETTRALGAGSLPWAGTSSPPE